MHKIFVRDMKIPLAENAPSEREAQGRAAFVAVGQLPHVAFFNEPIGSAPYLPKYFDCILLSFFVTVTTDKKRLFPY